MPSQEFKCAEAGCEVRFLLLEDLALHHRSFHRENALMKWLDYWDQKDKADKMGIPPSPRHPHIGIKPPKYHEVYAWCW